MMIKQKKSQISIFIIIGIILLFSTALVLYIKGKVGVVEKEVKVSVEKVPNEIQPVQDYVTSCIDRLAKEAIKKIGLHGGYISTDEKDYSLTLMTFSENDSNPTEADVVPFPPGSKTKVPYWAYMNSPNNCDTCTFASLKPPLYRTEGGNSIESQIDRYINANLRLCINNFEPFRKEGFTIEEKGTLQTTTYVRENDVEVFVDYPVQLTKGQSYMMEKYETIVPVRLKAIYALADYITQMSGYSRFMGTITLNWIAAFSGLSSSKLPPMSDFDISYDEVSWNAKDVEDNVKMMLQTYVPAIQLGGALSARDPRGYKDSIIRGLTAAMTLPQNITSSGMDAKFLYLGWPIYLDLGDSQLGPQSAQFPLLEIFPLKEYSFGYDLSYPAVIKLSDLSAFKGEGYNFMFALETNIRSNQPIDSGYEKIVIPSVDERNSFFCEQKQRNGGPITVIAYDSSNLSPLDDVTVTFIGSQQCTIGQTAYSDDPFGPNYQKSVLTDNFPVGIGTIKFSKAGYVSKNMTYATAVGTPDTITVYLDPMKTINATLVKLAVPTLLTAVLNPTSLKLMPSEVLYPDIGFVTVNKIDSEDQPVVAGLFVPSENDSEMTLSPGIYDVSILLVYNTSVTIPEAEYCKNWACTKTEKVSERTFNQYLYNNLEYKWNLTAKELYSAKRVKFQVIAPPIPKRWREVDMNTKMRDMVNSPLFYETYKPIIE